MTRRWKQNGSRWLDLLASPDRQKRNFHVTIQNKVEPQAELGESLQPFSFEVSGLH